MNDLATVSGDLAQLAYALDTFYFLLSGALVMWMAAGFAMLAAGLVRAKNTTEILTKNVLLYAIASVMYLAIGYNLMYINDSWSGVIPDLGFLIGDENTADAVIAGGDDAPYYSARSDFFFQVVFHHIFSSRTPRVSKKKEEEEEGRLNPKENNVRPESVGGEPPEAFFRRQENAG